MKLSHIAAVLFLMIGLLLGALYLMQPGSDAKRPATWNRPNPESPDEFPSLNDFFLLLHEENAPRQRGLDNVVSKWQPGNAIMILELLDWLRKTSVEVTLKDLLVNKLEFEKFDSVKMRLKIWQEDVLPHPQYAEFKKRLYSQNDRRFSEYFDQSYETRISLDEIVWGGVKRDGIPPLVNPEMLSVDEATYLEDDNVVFGVEINGDARAYPKRILAWHEMFRDTVGGEDVAGVYCTLCGTLIIYKTTQDDGTRFTLGTSGLLYRSNKLMYDHRTKSLWSTTLGEPVVGPLAGKNIQLEHGFVVTTTWGSWKELHPDTTVLSLNTGHVRDYSEGKAYESYFSHDNLFYDLPLMDSRLKNKAEILGLRAPGVDDKLAISAEFLAENPLYFDQLGEQDLVIVTDDSGANRVYEYRDVSFRELKGNKIIDSGGAEWEITEAGLKLGDRRMPRVPANRAFWFGWFSAFPETRLVK